MIRPATHADIPAVVAMAAKFYETTDYVDSIPFCEATSERLSGYLIDNGVLLVGESDGVVAGMVGLLVEPFVFRHSVLTAHEVIWWVEPGAQGAGLGRALLAAVEPACRELGALTIQMIHLPNSPPQAAALYERMGYRHSETSYTKDLQWASRQPQQ